MSTFLMGGGGVLCVTCDTRSSFHFCLGIHNSYQCVNQLYFVTVNKLTCFFVSLFLPVTDEDTVKRYYAKFEERFFQTCEKELLKINTFYSGNYYQYYHLMSSNSGFFSNKRCAIIHQWLHHPLKILHHYILLVFWLIYSFFKNFLNLLQLIK